MAALLLLTAQAASAYLYKLDLTAEPKNITTNSYTTITVYAYDEVRGGAPYAKGTIYISSTSGNSTIPFTTGSDGWYSVNYASTKAGTFYFTAVSSFNYSAVPAWGINVGIQTATSDPVTVIVKSHLILSIKPVVTYNIKTVTPTAIPGTPTPATPTATAATITPVPSIPASSTDMTAPATTLNITGATNVDGEYLGEILCGLEAQDNAGGSGVSVIQYSFNGTDWYTYTKPLSVVKEGTTFLYFRSSDNAGNTEVPNVKAIEIVAAAGATATSPASPSPSMAGAQATPGGSPGITALMLFVTAALLLAGHKARNK